MQLIDLARARFIGGDSGQRRRDQNGLGGCRDGRIGSVDRFGQRVGEILAADVSLLLLIFLNAD